jgi:prepilin-type N-terminal cleavage/methylation domain-containing protein
MYTKRNGFTLVELLTVLAIIALLAGLLFPALARVRREGRKTVSISNLRQCGIGLLLYCQDYDGETTMPSYEVAKMTLNSLPTCDPSDTWRNTCKEDWGKPLLGSYGYVRGIDRYASQQGWNEYLNWNSGLGRVSGSVLVSVFYADNVAIPFHGEQPTLGPICGPQMKGCLWPDHVIRFRLDGSVATTSWKTWHLDLNRTIFSWEGIFFHAE